MWIADDEGPNGIVNRDRRVKSKKNYVDATKYFFSSPITFRKQFNMPSEETKVSTLVLTITGSERRVTGTHHKIRRSRPRTLQLYFLGGPRRWQASDERKSKQ
jgi:hypothetical protein